MEKFLVLTTTTEQNFAAQTSETLENAGIPVMIEHVEILDGKDLAHGYRVMVPSQHSQSAMQLMARRDSAASAQMFN